MSQIQHTEHTNWKEVSLNKEAARATVPEAERPSGDFILLLTF